MDRRAMLQAMGLLGASGLVKASSDTEKTHHIQDVSRHFHFDSISDAIDNMELNDGDTFTTNFYLNECGGAKYLVKEYSKALSTKYLLDDVVNVKVGDNLWAILQHDGIIHAEQAGICGIGDETFRLQRFFEYCHIGSVHGVLAATDYTISNSVLKNGKAAVLSISTAIKGTKATFHYIGKPIESFISCYNILHCALSGIKVLCNNNIAAVIDIRNQSQELNEGSIYVSNCDIRDVKQSNQRKSPVAIQIIGEFRSVNVKDCYVDNVNRISPSLACTGISISDFVGIAEVSGNSVSNILTPDNKDADGIKVFGNKVINSKASLSAKAQIHNNIITNCQGRMLKLQISKPEIHGNDFIILDEFKTITEWRGIDLQCNNGDVFSNTFIIGKRVDFGRNATLVTAQNLRNDLRAKTTSIYKNRCSSETPIRSMFVLISNYNTCTYIIDDNEFLGAPVLQVVRHRVMDFVKTQQINLFIRNNKAEKIVSCLFDSFDDINFEGKLYLEIVQNNDLSGNLSSVCKDSLKHFAIGGRFRIRDNVGVSERVNWAFDMNELLLGNSFFTGAQEVKNKAPNMTNYFHVHSAGCIQHNISTLGGEESRRTTLDYIHWNEWQKVI